MATVPTSHTSTTSGKHRPPGPLVGFTGHNLWLLRTINLPLMLVSHDGREHHTSHWVLHNMLPNKTKHTTRALDTFWIANHTIDHPWYHHVQHAKWLSHNCRQHFASISLPPNHRNSKISSSSKEVQGVLPKRKTHNTLRPPQASNTDWGQSFGGNKNQVRCASEAVLQRICLAARRHERSRPWGNRAQPKHYIGKPPYKVEKKGTGRWQEQSDQRRNCKVSRRRDPLGSNFSDMNGKPVNGKKTWRVMANVHWLLQSKKYMSKRRLPPSQR